VNAARALGLLTRVIQGGHGVRRGHHQPAYVGGSQQHSIIWPIEDPAHVNERRKKAGFDLNVEKNAQRLNIPYHVLTLEDVRKMPDYQPLAH
jgi:hypothetical protein